MFYVKFFSIWRVLNSFANESKANTPHADAVQMQKIHNLCKQEKEVELTISLDQAKGRTSTEARVSLSG